VKIRALKKFREIGENSPVGTPLGVIILPKASLWEWLTLKEEEN